MCDTCHDAIRLCDSLRNHCELGSVADLLPSQPIVTQEPTRMRLQERNTGFSAEYPALSTLASQLPLGNLSREQQLVRVTLVRVTNDIT